MSRTFNLSLDQITPERQAVLRDQGMPKGAPVSKAVEQVYAQAREIFSAVASPSGISARLERADFDRIFPGEGQNERAAPLANIYPRARQLSLFALTMGAEISSRIETLFSENDFATASMLDSFASLAADGAVRQLEEAFARRMGGSSPAAGSLTLGYSPGYCGWHISGQKKLFAQLKPGQAGIQLNSSFLMSPLKSVSGVLVEGPVRIHQFDPKFTFCRSCRTHSCTARMHPAEVPAGEAT